MTKTVISSSSKNEEIAAHFTNVEAFNNNEVIVACIEGTSNEEIKRVMFIQKQQATSSSVGLMQALALGWNERINRTWVNFDVSQMPEGMNQGTTANEIMSTLMNKEVDTRIKTVQTLTQRKSETWEQKPMINRSNEVLLNSEKKPIYQNTELAPSDEEDVVIPIGFRIPEAEYFKTTTTTNVTADVEAPALQA